MAGGQPSAFDTDTPALVLRTTRYPLYHGSVGIIRSLGRVGVPVYGMHESWLSPAALSRYQRGRLFYQPEDARPDRLLERLAVASESLGGRAVLIPTDDIGAMFVAEHADALAERYLIPRQAADCPGKSRASSA